MNNIQKSGLFGIGVVILIFIGIYNPFMHALVRPNWIRNPEQLFLYIGLTLVVGVVFYVLFDDKILKVK